MAETALRRHDLVWLDPAAADRLQVATADRPVLEAWLAARRPLVVGRRDSTGDLLRLGFTVPGIGARQRVGVLAPLDAVHTHRPPPALDTVVQEAPQAWRPALTGLIAALAETGQHARCYGSLVTQIFSGEPCLRADSDLDVLIDCDDRDSAVHALAALARHGNGTPRIDGEVRLHGDRAVAWRELAGALVTGAQVLVKSNTTVQFLSTAAFLAAPVDGRSDDARPSAHDCLAA